MAIMYRCSLANKVISQQASGSFVKGNSGQQTFTTNHGFLPDLIIVRYESGSTKSIEVYSPEINGNNTPIIAFSGSVQGTKYAIGNTTAWRFSSFTDTTMTMNAGSCTVYWYAYKFDGGTKSVVGNIMKGTLVTNSASTDYVIDTGLSEVREFWLHGSGTSDLTLQHFVYYTEDDNTNYQTCTHLMPESNVGGSGKVAIGTALNRRCFTLKSINGGVITITTPTVNATFASCNLNWTAY